MPHGAAAVDLVIGEDQTTAQPQIDGVVAAGPIPASGWADGLSAFLSQACACLDPCEVVIATRLMVRALRNRNAEPVGVDPLEASGLAVWWTAEALAEHPDFAGEWPGP